MNFYNAKAMVEKAKEGGYAIPAFNTNGGTYDITLAAIESAVELHSPLIIQTYEPNLAYRGFEYCVLQASHLSKNVSIPIAMHLDHGSSFTSVLQAVKAGYTSVMIDCSHLSLDENIKMTRQVVDAVKSLDISVESELGHITGGVHSSGHNSISFTDSEEAVYFVKETGVDMLAIADGTKHGIFDRQDKIDLKLVQELRRRVSVPLVQHGTCGISLELIRGLVKAGIAKMNFGEVFRVNYISYFKEYADSLNHGGHPWKIMLACKNRLKEDMKEIIHALGSEGRV